MAVASLYFIKAHNPQEIQKNDYENLTFVPIQCSNDYSLIFSVLSGYNGTIFAYGQVSLRTFAVNQYSYPKDLDRTVTLR